MSLALNREYICKHIFPFSHPLGASIPYFPDSLLAENTENALVLFEKGLSALKLHKNSLPPLVLKCAQLSGHIECAHYLQSIWKDVLGLNVHIQELPWNVLRSQIEKKEFEVAGCFENTLSPAFLTDQAPYIPICMHTLLYTKHPHLQGELFDTSGCLDFSFLRFNE